MQQSLNVLNTDETAYQFSPNVLLYFAYSLLKENKWVQLENILANGIDKYPDFTDLYYINASCIIEAKKVEDFSKIPQLYITCLEIGEADPTKYETSRGVGSYKALYNLGLYYEITGHLQDAVNCYRQSGSMNYTPAQKRLDLLTKT
ncbi:hypothetical protein D1872_278710 [compost metagenome]